MMGLWKSDEPTKETEQWFACLLRPREHGACLLFPSAAGNVLLFDSACWTLIDFLNFAVHKWLQW
jgi:hypothetical protein